MDRRTAWLSLFLMLSGVLLWLWPIGLGGKMPVGGDVTQFSLGPMTVFANALHAGRLPLWNELWGYGFPGIGESQMGVYYPPHWFLYGLFSPERAYTLSLILHTLWGALGVWFAARRFGVSASGAGLSGFSWACCGFFSIHLPHQWGYTTGCWMPWAWGLGWSVIRAEGRPRDSAWLALVLAVQLLPGHFQLAFCTQVGLLVLVAEQFLEKTIRRANGFAGLTSTLTALAGAFLLAGMQLWPTLRLARLAAPRRDFEYLSGFAATPLHLVTFFAPGLFEVSPLWRFLVWDPLHTSPEEYLGYVGLAPLFLAFFAVASGGRASAGVRALLLVALGTMLLSLGPYVPGARYWLNWPGFSFFRAPARWTLASSLALCLLAGIGFDLIQQSPKARRALLSFSIAAALLVGLTVILVESAFHVGSRPLHARALDWLPWGESDVFGQIMREARRPNRDHRVYEAWARQGIVLKDAPSPVFANLRMSIYRQELTSTALLIFGLLTLSAISGVKRAPLLPIGLVLLTTVDLGYLTKPRRVDYGPVRPLVEQSPILARLEQEPAGTRTIDALRNMPMVAGMANASAYRTLDLPALDTMTSLAGRLPANDSEREIIRDALQCTGAGVRIFDPREALELRRRKSDWLGPGIDIEDKALAAWRFGADWSAQQDAGQRTFHYVSLPHPAAHAWLVPLTPARSSAILGTWTGSPFDVFSAYSDPEPVVVERESPERRTMAIHAKGPSLLILSELADPEWEAVQIGPGGEQPAKIERAFGRANQGAWMVIQVPGGETTVRLRYRGRDVYQGLAISAVSFVAFGVIVWRMGRRLRPREGEIQ